MFTFPHTCEENFKSRKKRELEKKRKKKVIESVCFHSQELSHTRALRVQSQEQIFTNVEDFQLIQ